SKRLVMTRALRSTRSCSCMDGLLHVLLAYDVFVLVEFLAESVDQLAAVFVVRVQHGVGELALEAAAAFEHEHDGVVVCYLHCLVLAVHGLQKRVAAASLGGEKRAR